MCRRAHICERIKVGKSGLNPLQALTAYQLCWRTLGIEYGLAIPCGICPGNWNQIPIAILRLAFGTNHFTPSFLSYSLYETLNRLVWVSVSLPPEISPIKMERGKAAIRAGLLFLYIGGERILSPEPEPYKPVFLRAYCVRRIQLAYAQ